MVLGLHRAVKRRGHRIPVLGGYGNGISIERIRFAGDREALTVDYAIIPDEEDNTSHAAAELQGFDELHAVREARRLTRSIECQLPSADGWDVQVPISRSFRSEEAEIVSRFRPKRRDLKSLSYHGMLKRRVSSVPRHYRLSRMKIRSRSPSNIASFPTTIPFSRSGSRSKHPRRPVFASTASPMPFQSGTIVTPIGSSTLWTVPCSQMPAVPRTCHFVQLVRRTPSIAAQVRRPHQRYRARCQHLRLLNDRNCSARRLSEQPRDRRASLAG
jgi:hypothetical protein